MSNYPKHRKPAPMSECPICGKIVHSRGLFSHIRLAHQLKITEVTSEKLPITQVKDLNNSGITKVIQQKYLDRDNSSEREVIKANEKKEKEKRDRERWLDKMLYGLN